MPKKRDKNKIKQVVQEYIRNGLDMTQAVAKIEKKPIDQMISNKAYRWKLDPMVISEIKRQLATFDKTIISEELVLFKLLEVINDDTVKKSDLLNALTICSKVLNMAKEGQQTVNIGFNIADLKTIPSVKSIS